MVLHRQLDWGDAYWTTGQRKRKRRKARMVAVVRLIFFRPHRIASLRWGVAVVTATSQLSGELLDSDQPRAIYAYKHAPGATHI